MVHLGLREEELVVDLESGGTTSEEDGTMNLVSARSQTSGRLNWVWTGAFGFDNPINSKCGMNFYSNSTKLGEAAIEIRQSLLDVDSEGECKENDAPLENNNMEQKCKKPNSRKASKPPRPPKGPLLDAADHKFMREIAELAMRKRGRTERIKALKKMKAAQGSNSYSSLSAMIITLTFCVIVIFQGFFSDSRSVSVDGSPAPAVSAQDRLIPVRCSKIFSASECDGPGPASANSAEGQEVPVLGSGKNIKEVPA